MIKDADLAFLAPWLRQVLTVDACQGSEFDFVILSLFSSLIYGFPKTRGTFPGVPVMRISGLLGSPISGNNHSLLKVVAWKTLSLWIQPRWLLALNTCKRQQRGSMVEGDCAACNWHALVYKKSWEGCGP